MIRHGRGWVPNDPRDPRNRDSEFMFALGAAEVEPRELDIESLLPPTQDQGSNAACVGYTAAQLEYAAMVSSYEVMPPYELPSPLVLWYMGRADAGVAALNAGTSLRTVFRLARQLGLCRDRHWPQSKHFAANPGPTIGRLAIDQAPGLRFEWLPVTGDEAQCVAVRSAIVEGLPVGGGCLVDDDYDSVTDEVVDAPDGGEGHAQVVCGYRFDRDRGEYLYKVRNSWDLSWGVRGCCWITSRYMRTWRDLVVVTDCPGYSDEVPS